MKLMKAPARGVEVKVPDAAAAVLAPAPAAPVAGESLAVTEAPTAADAPPVAAEAPVDPVVLRLDHRMIRIWLIGAGILVLLHLLDAFYRVLMRL